MKKIIILCAIALSTQFTFAQSPEFKADALAYVKSTGIEAQIQQMKQSIESYILSETKEAFDMEFHAAIQIFMTDSAQLIIDNFSENDLKNAIQQYKSTNEFASLPTVANEAEVNTKIQELQNKMLMDFQNIVMKYGDPQLFNQ